jgi:glutamate synthase domain-containing protein 2
MKENLRARLIIQSSAKQLDNFFSASTDLVKVIARACGHKNLQEFNFKDLSTTDYSINQLTGIAYAGVYKN